MDFKSLGANSPVYIIRKKPFLYEVGVLKSKTVKQQPNLYMPQPAPQAFDVVITVNGNDEVVPGITDSMEVVDYKGSYYSASVEGILQANANLAQMAKAGLEEQSYYQSVMAGAESVNEKLNPQYAENKKQAKTIKDLQDRQDEQGKKLDLILSRIDEVLNAPKTKTS